VYTEEKFEDEEDMRDRARNMMKGHSSGHERHRSDPEVVLEDLVLLAKQHGELYPIMVDILHQYGQLLQREIGMCVFPSCSRLCA
jgi:diaphanous 1